MDAIKKKMATLREKLEASEERARKAEDELSNTHSKAEEVSFLLNFVVIDLYNLANLLLIGLLYSFKFLLLIYPSFI